MSRKLPPRVQKGLLALHVASSVGWLGAVLAFLVLAVIGLKGQQSLEVTSAYIAMGLLGRALILPLSLMSVATGLVQGLTTPWGLIRHYWVTIKLVVTVLATGLLFVHQRPIDRAASAAAQATLDSPEAQHVRIQLVADSVLALAVLLLTTTLSVYKPRGVTRYGQRKAAESLKA